MADTKFLSQTIRPPFKKATPKHLYIDLIPLPLFEVNLRKFLTKDDWDLVRRATYKAAGYRCEKCGGVGPKWPVECHERWHYNIDLRRQILIGSEALCPDCHNATHYCHAQITGQEQRARNQLMKVNGWTSSQVNDHLSDAVHIFEERSDIKNWTSDMVWVCGFPISEASRKSIIDRANKWNPPERVPQPPFFGPPKPKLSYNLVAGVRFAKTPYRGGSLPKWATEDLKQAKVKKPRAPSLKKESKAAAPDGDQNGLSALIHVISSSAYAR